MEEGKLNWNLKVSDLHELSELYIREKRLVFDKIASLKDPNFNNTLGALERFDRDWTCLVNTLTLYQHVASSPELRTASSEADKNISNFDIQMSMRFDVFKVVNSLVAQSGTLVAEEKRCLEKFLLKGRKNGLEMEEVKRNAIEKLKQELSDLCIEFQKNLNEENTKLFFNPDQLNGTSQSFQDSLKKSEDGLLELTLSYPHFFPTMESCCVPETRMKLQKSFNSRCKDTNSLILLKVLKLRHELAGILGYKTFSDFTLDGVTMAATSQRVKEFLENLKLRLKSLGEQDLNALLELKLTETDDNSPITMYDYRYYMKRRQKLHCGIDHEAYRSYFPVTKVTDAVCDIYQELLGLKFTPDTSAKLWHEEVRCHVVHDASCGELLGHFFLDLFPREGKYGHACCIGIQPSCHSDTFSQPAVAVMLANFTRGQGDKPGLLTHDEVETYFHEFGHVMHQLCTRTQLSCFSGTRVERDFVETPSQMLENWCWSREGLKRLSCHFDTNEPLSDLMIDNLVKSRFLNHPLKTLRQVALSTLDFVLHTDSNVDLSVYDQIMTDILGIPPLLGTCMPATFVHLTGGYDSKYYGYLWSQVFAADMFVTRFEKEGIFSQRVGMDYRRFILEPGGTLDADVMLRNFLGREPNSDAFFRALTPRV
ncbi:Thimet oligopeptidase [Oopsacas minuta]|uniref:Thimet oligopeptidase n=1 Tax=Oopsacas minuta TaxID=111878 RepID=A0AAV7KEV1_9METZ|nr:Thimet oligopeptidase [Oopsacas minuta]